MNNIFDLKKKQKHKQNYIVNFIYEIAYFFAPLSAVQHCLTFNFSFIVG